MINKIYNLNNREINICDSEHFKKFSVFVPIIKRDDMHYILFEIRSAKLNKQPNEICFPGGKIEVDETKQSAAIRETCEELLINQENVQIICQLDTVVTPFSTIIYPFAGFIDNYNSTYNTDEVSEVFCVPFTYFELNKPKYYFAEISVNAKESFPFHLIPNGKNYPWGKGIYPTYFYEFEDKVIWGITARIIYNLINILQSEYDELSI